MSIILSDNIKKSIIWILAILLGMEMLDSSVLNTSLPQISASLNINPIQLKSALTVYLLSLGIFIPASGWLVDRVGEKHALLLAIIIFSLSSIGCGLATNLPTMVFFRLLQGVGGAFLMPVGRLILVRVFEGTARIQAMAKVTSIATLALLVGPLIGGALTTYLNWRWIFFINVPLSLIGAYYIYYHLPTLKEHSAKKFDLLGFLLIGTGLGTLLYLCDIAINPKVSSYTKIFLLSFAIFIFIAYRYHAKYCRAPLIALNVFRQPTFMAASLGSFFSRLTASTQPFLVPLLLQIGYGYTAFQAGLLAIPSVLGILANRACIAKLLERVPCKTLLIINTATLLFLFLSYTLQTFLLMPMLLISQQFLFGFVMATQFTAVNILGYKHLHEPYVNQGSSVSSIIIQVSGSFGIALAVLVMLAITGTNGLQPHTSLLALRVVFLVQSLYLLVAEWIFWKTKI